MAVFQLNDELWFPDPHLGNPDGLVAVGGDLSVERLLLAYSKGFFPWFSFRNWEKPHWFCPLDRYVIFPNEIHISHSMKQLMKQDKYEVTFNQYFQGVIRGCSIINGRFEENGAWLGPDIIKAYTKLHRKGFAASVEVWDNGWLIGGLYGVVMRGKSNLSPSSKEGLGEVKPPSSKEGLGEVSVFFGESMFSLVPNASKLALIALAQKMEEIGGHFIDCQFETPHLASMGGRHITYEQYMKILDSGHQDHKSM